MLETNLMYVQDENGEEVAMRILFTFDANEKNYVVFCDANDEVREEVFASCYDEESGALLPIETDAEWAMIEEVIGAFMDEENDFNEE